MIAKNNILSRRVIVLLLFTIHCSLFTATAQDKPEPYIDAALVSHYMWRGQDLGNVCFQPEIGVQWKGFTLDLEGSTGFRSNDYEELDFHLFYDYKSFHCGLSDIWSEAADDPRYFSYDKHRGGHQFEGEIGYQCKYGSLTWHTIFAGNDYKINSKRAYSSFVELAIPFRFYDLDWEFRGGLCPYESAGGEYRVDGIDDEGNPTYWMDHEWYYASGFGVNMLSLRVTKNFPLGNSKFKLPVFVEIHTNPAAGHARILMGISLATL
ncbi:MAG: hypothetical protein IJ618_01535 [Prevotella sp.]|nr:hypothetical protein [Prevotella sp.]